MPPPKGMKTRFMTTHCSSNKILKAYTRPTTKSWTKRSMLRVKVPVVLTAPFSLLKLNPMINRITMAPRPRMSTRKTKHSCA